MSTVHDHVQLNNKNKTNNNVEKMLCPENKTLKLNNEWLWRTVWTLNTKNFIHTSFSFMDVVISFKHFESLTMCKSYGVCYKFI